MFRKIYLEITNRCNLSCSFCHKTDRTPRSVTPGEFDYLTDALRGHGETLYFHLMGEPLLHPDLPSFIRSAAEKGFRPAVTTNGTLLERRGAELLQTPLYKISISLHAPEANPAFSDRDYMLHVLGFAREAAEKGIWVALRLWNRGGLSKNNETILQDLHEAFPDEWVPTRSGARVGDRIFLERASRFDWPDLNAPEYSGSLFCYGLRHQIGVLCDGSVVPCCLDADGVMTLGNLYDAPLEDILAGERARKIYDGFTAHRAEEELCRKCGYAAVTKRHREHSR